MRVMPIRALAEKPSGHIMFSDFYGKANEVIVKVTSATQYNSLIKSFFTPDDWASDKAKRLIISGVDFGNITGAAALVVTDTASGQAGSFGGKLTLEIEAGAFISGSGGKWSPAGSGNGGIALHVNFKGKDGNNLQLINKGIIRGGGGSGGQGGKGGGGFYTVSETINEPADGNIYVEGATGAYMWVNYQNGVDIYWNGKMLYGGASGSTEATHDGITYYRGDFHHAVRLVIYYSVRRSFQRNTNLNTDGGAGGGGGTGQGFSADAGSGASGNAGGTNAGCGGKGGHGGMWGNSGNRGETGTSGNNADGLAGVLGGIGGAAIDGIANVDVIESSGQIIGRQE